MNLHNPFYFLSTSGFFEDEPANDPIDPRFNAEQMLAIVVEEHMSKEREKAITQVILDILTHTYTYICIHLSLSLSFSLSLSDRCRRTHEQREGKGDHTGNVRYINTHIHIYMYTSLSLSLSDRCRRTHEQREGNGGLT